MKVMYNGLVVGSKAYRGLRVSVYPELIIQNYLRSMSSRLQRDIVLFGTTASPAAHHGFHRTWPSCAVWPKEDGSYSEEVPQ